MGLLVFFCLLVGCLFAGRLAVLVLLAASSLSLLIASMPLSQLGSDLYNSLNSYAFVGLVFLVFVRELLQATHLPRRLALFPRLLFRSGEIGRKAPFFLPLLTLLMITAFTGQLSIVSTFVGALFPCLLIGTLVWVARVVMTPSFPTQQDRSAVRTPALLLYVGQAMFDWLFVAFLFLIFFSSLAAGLMTPTEAAVFFSIPALIYGLIISVVLYGEESPVAFFRSGMEAGKKASLLLLTLGGSFVLFRFFSYTGAMQEFIQWTAVFYDTPFLLLLVLLITAFVASLFIEQILVLSLWCILFFPILHQLDLNPIYVSVLVAASVAPGLYLSPETHILGDAPYRLAPSFRANLYRYRFVLAIHLAIVALCLCVPVLIEGPVAYYQDSFW